MAVISKETIRIEIEGVDGVTRSYKAIRDAQTGVERSTEKQSRSLRRAGGAFDDFKGRIVAAQAALGLFSQVASGVGRALGALKAPADLAISFEQGFAKITTLLDGPTESFGKLKTELLNLAADVPQTAEDISLAAYQAISAGVPHEEVAAFLKTASQAAVGAGSTLTEAVEVLTTSVNGFKTESMDASKAANILFATQKQGVTTVRELQQNLGKATGLAQFGVRMDEVTAAVAQLTKLGTPTSEAFTRIVAVVKALAVESGPAAKNLRKYGVEVGVAALKNKGLAGVLADVQEKTGGSAEIISGLTRRFEAQDGMLKLLGPNFEDFNKILAGNRAEVDYVGDAFGKMQNTTQGAMDQFNALKEDVMRRLGEELLPMVNDGLERMQAALKEGGGAFIKEFAGGLKALFSFGVWIVEHAEEILFFLKTAFMTRALIGFIAMMQKAVLSIQAFSAAAGAAGMSAGSSLAAGLKTAGAAALRSPNILAAFAGIGMLLGQKLGEAFGDSLNSEVVAAAEKARREAEQAAAEFALKLEAATGKTVDEMSSIRDEQARGERLGFGRTLDVRTMDADEVTDIVSGFLTPTEMMREMMQEVEEHNAFLLKQGEDRKELSDAEQVAYDETREAIEREIEAHEKNIQAQNREILHSQHSKDLAQERADLANHMIRHKIAVATNTQKAAQAEAQVAHFANVAADAALRRSRSERAIVGFREWLLKNDPNYKKQMAALKAPAIKPIRGGSGKSKAQKRREAEAKEAAKLEVENEKMRDRSARSRLAHLSQIEELELRRKMIELGILEDRAMMIRLANGKEVRVRAEHIEKLKRLDGSFVENMALMNIRFATQEDERVEELGKIQRKEIAQFIKNAKIVQRIRKQEAKEREAEITGEKIKGSRLTGTTGDAEQPALVAAVHVARSIQNSVAYQAGNMDEEVPLIKDLFTLTKEQLEAMPDDLADTFISVNQAIRDGVVKAASVQEYEIPEDAFIPKSALGIGDAVSVVLSRQMFEMNKAIQEYASGSEEAMERYTQIQADIDKAFDSLQLPPMLQEEMQTMFSKQRKEAETAIAAAREARKQTTEKQETEEGLRASKIREQRLTSSAEMEERHQGQLQAIQSKYTEMRKQVADREAQEGRESSMERRAIAQAEDQEIQQIEKQHQDEKIANRLAYHNRIAEIQGGNFDQELANLTEKHRQELEMYRQQGLDVAELVKAQSDELRRFQVQNFTQTTERYASSAANIVSNVKGVMSVYGNLAQARMRTAQIELKAGKITQKEYDRAEREAGAMQEKLIIAQGVYHAFMGIAEQANALTAFASFPNPLAIPKGLAHQAAAIAHFANAKAAPEMARHARIANQAGLSGGGGGGGGGAGSGAGGPSGSGGPGYMERAELTEAQKANQGMQFGDIILSDLPYLLSADGATELGRHIAGAVVEEVNQNAYIQGGYRVSRRAQRR